jgi:aryl-alcohol dehydrogenase-like predicted oxidoreductase
MTKLYTKNGTSISRLGFGAMQFGRTAEDLAACEIFGACIASGINHFDTAFSYSGGASERMLGKLTAHMADDIILATKAASDRPATKQNLRDVCEQSRIRLGADCIDIYYLHRFDAETPLAETFGALAHMQSAGLIRYIGVSNFAAWQIMKAQAVCTTLGTKIDVCQPMYNLVKRQAATEILPACQDQDIAVCPYSPLGGGLLTGKYSGGASGRLTDDRTYAARYGQTWMHEAAKGLVSLSEALKTTSATLAVAWVAHNPAVASTLISARNIAQLQPSLDALGFELSDEAYMQISKLSPKPAPATDRSEET